MNGFKKINMIKPDLTQYFEYMPLIGMYLNHDYTNAKTVEDLCNLCHKWATIADETTNQVKKLWYEVSYKALFSIITNKSFDSRWSSL
jgi:hypothetical protein